MGCLEMGTPIDFNRIGWLSVTTEEGAAELRDNAAQLQSLGIETEILSPEEIGRRYPEIRTDDLALGTWGPDDGTLDPHMIMWGYINRAIEWGARLHQGVRASGIEVRGGRVRGVHTSKGFVSAPVVVNAAGPWATEVGRWAGVDIPILNLVRNIVVTNPFPEIPPDRPFVEDMATEWYYRPEGPCILMGWGEEPAGTLDVHVDYETLLEMIEIAVQRVPVLERASVQTSWAGIRPLTPDGRPIVGPVPAVEGLFLNAGWGGTGIIHAPAAGQLMAEYIVHGSTAVVDREAVGLGRF